VALLGECIECGACWFITFVNIVNSFRLHYMIKRQGRVLSITTHNQFRPILTFGGSGELTKSRIGRG